MSAENSPNRPEIRKWEYCVVHFVKTGSFSLKRVLDFPGVEKSTRQEIKNGRDIDDISIEKDFPIMARLGEEGWELVNTTDNGNILLFKRPRF